MEGTSRGWSFNLAFSVWKHGLHGVITSSPLGRTCAAPTSHEDLQVERMFPGHPDCPAKVVRGGLRVYLFIYSFIYLIGFHLHSFRYDCSLLSGQCTKWISF